MSRRNRVCSKFLCMESKFIHWEFLVITGKTERSKLPFLSTFMHVTFFFYTYNEKHLSSTVTSVDRVIWP